MDKLNIKSLSTDKFKLESCSLAISDDATMQEWMEIGKSLARVNGVIQFWTGDWARYGEKRGFYTNNSVYSQIEKATGHDRATLWDFKSVSEHVQPSLRNDLLTYNHHRVVAGLSAEEQAFYLRKASEQKMSVRELRKKIRIDHRPVEQLKFWDNPADLSNDEELRDRNKIIAWP